MPRRLAVVLTVAASLLAGSNGLAVERQDVPGGIVWSWPHPGRVTAPFVDSGGFVPEHAGIDLDAAPGDDVRAPADGVVGFAGAAGPRHWVTIAHGPGLVSTVGPLARIDVSVGDDVADGRVVGTLAADPHGQRRGLHLGMRLNGDYFDPLWVLPRRRAPRASLVGRGDWEPSGIPSVPHYDDWDGRHFLGFVPDSDRATHAGWVFPPNPNHVIGVAGLNSSTESTPIDLEHLGYAGRDITYLSWSGIEDPGPPDIHDPRRDQRPHEPVDTWEGVAAASARLADQLRVQWQRSPGQAVDLVGHSMGGLVVLHYLAVHHDPADPTLPPIAHVATFASPIDGLRAMAELQEARESSVRWTVDRLDGLAGGLANSQALADVARGSDIVDAIATMWRDHRDNPLEGPLVDTAIATFGGQWDVVVPEHASDLGDTHVVLPGGHSSMRETEAARIVLRAFLAGQPVPGEAGGIGHLVSYGTDWLGGFLVDRVFTPCVLCEL